MSVAAARLSDVAQLALTAMQDGDLLDARGDRDREEHEGEWRRHVDRSDGRTDEHHHEKDVELVAELDLAAKILAHRREQIAAVRRQRRLELARALIELAKHVQEPDKPADRSAPRACHDTEDHHR